MIRIGVFSDTHHYSGLLDRILEQLNGCDYLVFLGDGEDDVWELNRREHFLNVHGNCDFLPSAPAQRITELEGVKILMTHGHLYNVKHSRLQLRLKAQEIGAQLVLYGHTHTQLAETDNGITLLNPGAAAHGRYAIVEIENAKISYTFHTV